ncbi:VLP3p-3, transcript variant X1 [Venturia canescens]|uniref:VLP3p-3, transcript variant X2 n=2 Tax=Venturia canescens TaxID=32260 RepID=A0ACB9ZHP0_9HYME|nr:neprilysin-2-like [Venturia canescens]XP_043279259.1 neprilysin-2-like [Venturia canescens]KAI5630567.1 VLP3p-3, transcript variant X2 [Venturia canescens]KAI5630568.1 VLP3p-3, transcript variant X1 [Venturia canescens]
MKALVRSLTGIEVSIVFILCISLMTEETVTNINNNFNSTAGYHENLCLTPECLHTASMIQKNIDSSVDPCDNFYGYACGGFIKNTIIPNDEGSVNSYMIIHKIVQERLKAIMQAECVPNEPKHFGLVKKLYKACMNTRAIEARGFEPILKILRYSGGWPVLDGNSWESNEFNWMKSIHKLREAGSSFDYFVKFDVSANPVNNTHRVIILDQPSLGIDSEHVTKDFDTETLKAYYNEMVEFAVMLGADKTRATKELRESLMFEMKLAKISSPREKRRNATQLYNPMTLSQLSKKYPNVKWKEYFNRLLPSSIIVDEEELVIVYEPSYIAHFDKLISQTPKKVQANYVMWRTANTLKNYMSKNLFAGLTDRNTRAEECIPTIAELLPNVVGAMYVKKYFDERSKKNAAEMVMDMRKRFTNILKTLDWMDETTRTEALNKATAMQSHIAYPDELLDDDKLENFYAKLELSGNHYFESVLKVTLFNTEYTLSQLRKPINKTEWLSHGSAAVVNAFYSAVKNSIQFTAGLLQGTLFASDRPKYMNYGAIGFIIGHEITHGFDREGKQFDKDGNLVDWWAPATEEKYLKRVQCIINQYNNYTVREVDLKLNGVNTLSENIADNGGIKIAYQAYSSWAAKNNPEKRLPGIDKTPKQMFWLSAANVWCAKYTREDLRSRVISDVHSPSEFRVLGSFSNMLEFANDFQCPVGSKMNPIKKCSFW